MRDEIVGKRFGWMEVVRYEGKQNYMPIFLCRCECGDEKVVRGQSLVNGAIRSCGCKRGGLVSAALTKHGHAPAGHPTRVYTRWKNMVQRCSDPKSRRWKNYGGRGIKVCDRWLKFENFLTDMGEPAPGMTLERIDSNGNYEPTNCKWATYAEQNRNYSRNHKLTFRGETLCLADWTDRLGMRRGTIAARLKRGWTVERALTQPVAV